MKIVIDIPDEDYERINATSDSFNSLILLSRLYRAIKNGIILSKGHGKLTNHDWIDFLCKQFDISRTSAKEMLHVMMSVKKEDNFKKQFSGRK